MGEKPMPECFRRPQNTRASLGKTGSSISKKVTESFLRRGKRQSEAARKERVKRGPCAL